MRYKTRKKKISAVLAVSMLLSPVSTVLTPSMIPSVQVQAASGTGHPQKGWYTTRKGKKKYYRNKNCLTGLQKIRKNYYYFDDRGIMQTGTIKVKKTTYYLDEKGVLEAYQKKSNYYHANGKKMSKTESLDFRTLQTAKSIVRKITNPHMSQEQKLKKCFDWVISKPYITRRTFSNTAGWPAVYANDHFLLGGGNCFADAAAFAYLAKALGYKKVYVCVDCDGSGGRGHSWTEINGLAYDPLFAEAKSYSANYGVPYGTYILHPILHIAL